MRKHLASIIHVINLGRLRWKSFQRGSCHDLSILSNRSCSCLSEAQGRCAAVPLRAEWPPNLGGFLASQSFAEAETQDLQTRSLVPWPLPSPHPKAWFSCSWPCNAAVPAACPTSTARRWWSCCCCWPCSLARPSGAGGRRKSRRRRILGKMR